MDFKLETQSRRQFLTLNNHHVSG